MKLFKFLPILTFMALSTTGCGVLKNKPAKENKTEAVEAKAENVETVSDNDIVKQFEGDWSIVEVDGKDIVVNGENHPQLTFTTEGNAPGMISVIGFNGCNYLNGVWNIKGSRIVPAGELISTMKACDDAPYETDINLALNMAASYQLTNQSDMTIYSSTSKELMKLRRHNLSYLNGAWKVTKIDGEPITAKIQIVIDVDEHKIHGNAGCNLLNGDITVNLDKGDGIEFKNLATSRMYCPDIAVEQAFLLALENVDTASRGTTPDTAVFKNTSGKVILTLEKISAAELSEG